MVLGAPGLKLFPMPIINVQSRGIGARGAVVSGREDHKEGRRSCLFVVLIFMVLLGACDNAAVSAASPRGTRVETTGGAYTNIEPEELQALLAHKNFPLLNVHTPYEGEIEKTDANIPYHEIDKIVAKLPSDKNAMVVLYCRSGRMSQTTTEALVTLGYTNVWHLDRGMVGWKETGFPIVTRTLP